VNIAGTVVRKIMLLLLKLLKLLLMLLLLLVLLLVLLLALVELANETLGLSNESRRAHLQCSRKRMKQSKQKAQLLL